MRFIKALIIAIIILVIEFKATPFILKKTKLLKTEKLSPINEIERSKFELTIALRESGIEIISGPFSREEIQGIETAIKINGYCLKVAFSSKKEPRSQLASLQLILKEAKILEKSKEGKPPKLIDLSGDKPYVSF